MFDFAIITYYDALMHFITSMYVGWPYPQDVQSPSAGLVFYDCMYFPQHFCIFLQLMCIFSIPPPPFFSNFSYPPQFGVRSLLSTHLRPFWLYKRS